MAEKLFLIHRLYIEDGCSHYGITQMVFGLNLEASVLAFCCIVSFLEAEVITFWRGNGIDISRNYPVVLFDTANVPIDQISSKCRANIANTNTGHFSSYFNSNEPNLKAVIYKITAVEQILVSIQNQVSTGSVLLIANIFNP